MNEEEFDIYDDLEVIPSKFEEEKQKLVKEYEDVKQKYDQLKVDYDRLVLETDENKVTVEQISILKKNFESMWATTKVEIDRKKREIETLRREKDDLVFRRHKQTKSKLVDKIVQTDVICSRIKTCSTQTDFEVVKEDRSCVNGHREGRQTSRNRYHYENASENRRSREKRRRSPSDEKREKVNHRDDRLRNNKRQKEQSPDRRPTDTKYKLNRESNRKLDKIDEKPKVESKPLVSNHSRNPEKEIDDQQLDKNLLQQSIQVEATTNTLPEPNSGTKKIISQSTCIEKKSLEADILVEVDPNTLRVIDSRTKKIIDDNRPCSSVILKPLEIQDQLKMVHKDRSEKLDSKPRAVAEAMGFKEAQEIRDRLTLVEKSCLKFNSKKPDTLSSCRKAEKSKREEISTTKFSDDLRMLATLRCKRRQSTNIKEIDSKSIENEAEKSSRMSTRSKTNVQPDISLNNNDRNMHQKSPVIKENRALKPLEVLWQERQLEANPDSSQDTSMLFSSLSDFKCSLQTENIVKNSPKTVDHATTDVQKPSVQTDSSDIEEGEILDDSNTEIPEKLVVSALKFVSPKKTLVKTDDQVNCVKPPKSNRRSTRKSNDSASVTNISRETIDDSACDMGEIIQRQTSNTIQHETRQTEMPLTSETQVEESVEAIAAHLNRPEISPIKPQQPSNTTENVAKENLHRLVEVIDLQIPEEHPQDSPNTLARKKSLEMILQNHDLVGDQSNISLLIAADIFLQNEDTVKDNVEKEVVVKSHEKSIKNVESEVMDVVSTNKMSISDPNQEQLNDSLNRTEPELCIVEDEIQEKEEGFHGFANQDIQRPPSACQVVSNNDSANNSNDSLKENICVTDHNLGPRDKSESMHHLTPTTASTRNEPKQLLTQLNNAPEDLLTTPEPHESTQEKSQNISIDNSKVEESHESLNSSAKRRLIETSTTQYIVEETDDLVLFIVDRKKKKKEKKKKSKHKSKDKDRSNKKKEKHRRSVWNTVNGLPSLNSVV